MSIENVKLGRFGIHPDPAIDFVCEVERLENAIENERLGLCGFGHEQERANIDVDIERALDFRPGGCLDAIAARQALRTIARARGFDLTGVVAYAGQPIPRIAASARGEL